MSELNPTQLWYAKNSYLKNGKVVDWDRIAITRKEYFHTGTSRAYLELVGCEYLLKNKFEDFYRELDEELRLYDESKTND
jgi:hypothetical protein